MQLVSYAHKEPALHVKLLKFNVGCGLNVILSRDTLVLIESPLFMINLIFYGMDVFMHVICTFIDKRISLVYAPFSLFCGILSSDRELQFLHVDTFNCAVVIDW